MHFIKLLLLLCALCVGIVGPLAFAQTASTGWTLFRKLQSVKPQALSSTYYLQGDLSGVLYNPSLLALSGGRELDITTGFGTADERVVGSVFSFPWKNDVNLAAGLFNYDYGTMDLNWIDGNEIKSRTVSAQSDYMAMVSAGKLVGKHVGLGVNVKAASSRIAEEATAYAFAVDGGLTWFVNNKLSCVVAAQNVGYTTKFIDRSEKLPTAIMGGVSYLQNIANGYVILAADAPYLMDESRFTPSVGIEIGKWPFSFFAGYRTYVDDAALSYGISLTQAKYDFSYSYTPAQWLDGMHRVAFSMKFDSSEDIRNKIRLDYKAKVLERKEKKRLQEIEDARIAKEEQLDHEKRIAERQQRLKESIEQAQQLAATSTVASTATATVPIPVIATDFYILDVVDARQSQVLGYAKQKGKHSGSFMALNEGVRAFVYKNFAGYTKKDENKIPVLMEIQSLSIGNEKDSITAAARVRFYAAAGDRTGKGYTEDGFVESFSEDRSEGIHLANVALAINDCLRKFSDNGWEHKDIVTSSPALRESVSVPSELIRKYDARIGLGIGIPYGIYGGNLEINTGDYASLSFGLGYGPAGAAYAVGGRLYCLPRDRKFRPYFSLHYGVVAVLENQMAAGTQYENIQGTAFGIGYRHTYRRSSWDFDVLFLNYDVPAGAQKNTSNENIKFSFGYGWHF